MTEIQIDRDNIQESPFPEEVVLARFYAGAGRGEMLSRMKDAVASGVSLIVLSGGEGSGKTMMCRMLENEGPTSTAIILFPHTVESFEDVVRKIIKRLGLKPAADDGKNIDVSIEQINAHLVQTSRGILIIFDEAENIYLATLERIRKMLDRITAAGGRMHILFSGRKTFLENCEQLSICDFKNSYDLHFDLLPLSEAETAEYLRICSERLTGPDKKKVFNDEVVRNIHGLAKGNFRMINLLADESLRSHGSDTSFMVLLENVKDEVGAVAEKIPPMLPLMKRYASYLPWIGGALCTLLLLFFLFRSPVDRSAIKPEVKPSSEDVAKAVTAQPEGGGPQPIAQAVVREETHPLVQPEPVGVPETPGAVVEEKVGKALESEPLETPVKAVSNVKDANKITGKTTEVAQSASTKAVQQPPAVVREKPPSVAVTKVVELRQTPALKVKPASEPVSGAGTIKAQPRREVQDAIAVNTSLTVDQLFQKRIGAGSSWLTGAKDKLFTIQLMVLTANNAETNFKKMLAQHNYRQEAGNFFIFKKSAVPEVVLVFYGEYPTLELARLAQNSLPEFLREHQPYAISIKGAIVKARK